MNKSIIKSCLLGLNSKSIDFSLFPEEVQAYLDFTKESSETLLDALSLQATFMMAGKTCTHVENISEALPICEDETLPYASKEVDDLLKLIFSEKNYSLKTFLPLTIQKLVLSNTIVKPEFLPKILPLLDKSLKEIKEESLQCFGKRGIWIYNFVSEQVENPTPKPYIEQTRSEKTATFKNLMRSDLAEALHFLEEIYAAETPANQLNYLKNSPLQQFTPEILVFLKNHFDTLPDNKANRKLKSYFQLMWLHFPENELADDAFENFFSKIWIKKGFLKSTKLVSLTALQKLYNAFDNELIENFYSEAKVLEPIDRFLFFALVSVPTAKWITLLELSTDDFVKLIAKISPVDSPKVQKYSFLNALVLNAVIHKDLQTAEKIFEISQFEYTTEDFLALFSPENLMEKCVKHSKSLNHSAIKLYELDLKLLPRQWNEELTKVALSQCLESITNNRAKLNNALWKMGPFLHQNALNIFDKTKYIENHSYTLRDDFQELMNIKIAFDKI